MTTVDPGEELIQQQARHQRLLREHAVLEAREAEKTKRRDEIRAQLKAAGVDPDHPEEEKRRLEAETTKALAENNRLLDEFEAKLKTAAGTLPTEDLNPPKPSGTSAPSIASEPSQARAPGIESEPSTTSAPKTMSEPSTTSAPLTASEPKDRRAPGCVSEPEIRRAPTAVSEPSGTSAPQRGSEPPQPKAPTHQRDTVLTIDIPDDIEI